MPLDAFVLALGSAFLHALWNLILGRERDPEAATAVALVHVGRAVRAGRALALRRGRRCVAVRRGHLDAPAGVLRHTRGGVPPRRRLGRLSDREGSRTRPRAGRRSHRARHRGEPATGRRRLPRRGRGPARPRPRERSRRRTGRRGRVRRCRRIVHRRVHARRQARHRARLAGRLPRARDAPGGGSATSASCCSRGAGPRVSGRPRGPSPRSRGSSPSSPTRSCLRHSHARLRPPSRRCGRRACSSRLSSPRRSRVSASDRIVSRERP